MYMAFFSCSSEKPTWKWQTVPWQVIQRQADTCFGVGCASLAIQKRETAEQICSVQHKPWRETIYPNPPRLQPQKSGRKPQRSSSKYYRSQIAQHDLHILTTPGTEYSSKHLTLCMWAKKWVYPDSTEVVQPRETRWLSQDYKTAGKRSGSLRHTFTTQVWEPTSGSGSDYIKRKIRSVILQILQTEYVFPSPSFSIAVLSLVSLEAQLEKLMPNSQTWPFSRPKPQIPTWQSSDGYIWESHRVQQGKPLQGSSCCFTTRYF